MTRINVIPPELMLNEWVSAHCKETLRPINKLMQGKYVKDPIVGQYRLKTGHELWGAGHGVFLTKMWSRYKAEYVKRGFKGFDYEDSLDLSSYPVEYSNDYTPTVKDIRTNLARLCERFRKRKKPYHFYDTVIDSNKDFLVWLNKVKQELLS